MKGERSWCISEVGTRARKGKKKPQIRSMLCVPWSLTVLWSVLQNQEQGNILDKEHYFPISANGDDLIPDGNFSFLNPCHGLCWKGDNPMKNIIISSSSNPLNSFPPSCYYGDECIFSEWTERIVRNSLNPTTGVFFLDWSLRPPIFYDWSHWQELQWRTLISTFYTWFPGL